MSAPPMFAASNSPMNPVAPATKKLRAGIENDDAVMRRRLELKRLQEDHQRRAASKGVGRPLPQSNLSSVDGLSSRVRSKSHSGPPRGPSLTTSGPPAAPPIMGMGAARKSDIFPTVAKVSPSRAPPHRGSNPPPRGTPRGRTPPPRGRTPTPPTTRPPPTAGVARRLDPSFSDGKSKSADTPNSRAKSAPPERPPPPPPTASKPAEAPETSRHQNVRPPPISLLPPPASPKVKPPEPKEPHPDASAPPQAPSLPPKAKLPPSEKPVTSLSSQQPVVATLGPPPIPSSTTFVKTETSDAVVGPPIQKTKVASEPSVPPPNNKAVAPEPTAAPPIQETTLASEPVPPLVTEAAGAKAPPQVAGAALEVVSNGVAPKMLTVEPETTVAKTPAKPQAAALEAVSDAVAIDGPPQEINGASLPGKSEVVAASNVTPVVSEQVMESTPSKTPSVDKDGHQIVASTVRKDLIKNLRQFAETPPSRKKESDEVVLRMEKKIQEQESDKAELMRKVANLEKELLDEKQKAKAPPKLETLEQFPPSGDKGGVKFVQDVANTPRHMGLQLNFLSPLSAAGGSAMGPVTPRVGFQRRSATPFPKRKVTETGGDKENDLLFTEATKIIPFEYGLEEAETTLVIRRPFGLANERELWFQAGQLVSKKYQKSVDLKKQSTLEVVAKIGADNSMLVLFDEANVLYRSSDDEEWKDYGNVNDLERPLGSITYIDSDANERDYSLDAIFLGALQSRDHYCSSILSMVEGLRKKKQQDEKTKAAEAELQPPPQETSEANTSVVPQQPVIPTTDACVGTEDLPYVDPRQSEGSDAMQNEEVQEPKEPASEPPKHLDEESSGAGTILVEMFFSTLVWIVFTIVIRIPFKIISFTFLTLVAATVLLMLKLYITDDHGAHDMGATISFMHNEPGVL